MVGLDVKPQHIWDYKRDTILSFSVKETYTTEDAKQLTIKQRHCIFSNERKLNIDNIYTYTACTRQCRMDNSINYCNCVPHFYSIENINNFDTNKGVNVNNYKHCDINQLECIIKHLNQIENVDKCDCQLGCSNTVYEIEKLNYKIQKDENENDNLKSMETEFISWPMIKYKREVLFGWVDLLVSFGGIAGLFLGFSLLSGVEIIYYFTIRTYFMVYKERKYLEKIYRNEKLKTKPKYNLGVEPYFITTQLPGGGNRILKEEYLRHIKKTKKITPIDGKWKISEPILPPFGIEYLN